MGGGVRFLGDKFRMVSCDLKGSNIQSQYLVILVLLCVSEGPQRTVEGSFENPISVIRKNTAVESS